MFDFFHVLTIISCLLLLQRTVHCLVQLMAPSRTQLQIHLQPTAQNGTCTKPPTWQPELHTYTLSQWPLCKGIFLRSTHILPANSAAVSVKMLLVSMCRLYVLYMSVMMPCQLVRRVYLLVVTMQLSAADCPQSCPTMDSTSTTDSTPRPSAANTFRHSHRPEQIVFPTVQRSVHFVSTQSGSNSSNGWNGMMRCRRHSAILVVWTGNSALKL